LPKANPTDLSVELPFVLFFLYIVPVTHTYGSKLGLRGYYFDMDFNFDFQMDAGDQIAFVVQH
jgi:hypothetical protein